MGVVVAGTPDEYRGGEEPTVYSDQLDVELCHVRSVFEDFDKTGNKEKRPVLSRFFYVSYSPAGAAPVATLLLRSTDCRAR